MLGEMVWESEWWHDLALEHPAPLSSYIRRLVFGAVRKYNVECEIEPLLFLKYCVNGDVNFSDYQFL